MGKNNNNCVLLFDDMAKAFVRTLYRLWGHCIVCGDTNDGGEVTNDGGKGLPSLCSG